MAEALAGLSIAANIAQFVTLGLQGATFIWNVYNSSDGVVAGQKELQSISESVRNSCERLRNDASIVPDSDLDILLQRAISLSRELNRELTKLQRLATDQSYLGKTRLLFRAARKKGTIELLQDRLVNARDQATFQLVTLSYQSRGAFLSSSLGSKADTYSSEAIQKMDQLHQKLKDFQQSLEKLSDEEKTGKFDELAAQTRAVVSRCDEWKQAENVLRSLHYKQISERKSDIKVAHQQTFSWTLSEEKTSLADWLRNESGVYWIKGKAGSGKSTLMKHLTSDQEPRTRELLKEWAQGQELLIASHFFWAPGTKLQCNINGLFRGLLFQILMQYPQLIHEVCPKRTNKGSFQYLESWTTAELHASFMHLSSLSRLPAKICLFVDGLDEFQGEFNELISLIQTITCSDGIKMCVASRPWVQFHEAFGHLPWQLRVEDLTGEDIKTYVKDNLYANKHFIDLQETMEDKAHFLMERITNRADGVFLWVYLVTRNLLRGLTNADNMSTLVERLDQFPADLEEYFMAMLISIEDIYHVETSAIFRMLQHSPSSQLSFEVIWAYQHMWRIVEGFKQQWKVAQSTSNIHFDHQMVFRDAFEAIGNVKRYEPLVKMTRELTYITSSCKDLIYIRPSDRQDGATQKIGFLHRSVADFLSLPRTSAVLNDRLAKDFDSRIALCEAYLLIYCHRARRDEHDKNKVFEEIDADRLLLVMLYLIQQSQIESMEPSKPLILLLSAAIKTGENRYVMKLFDPIRPNTGACSLYSFRALLGHICGVWSDFSQITARFGPEFSILWKVLTPWPLDDDGFGSMLEDLLQEEPLIDLLEQLPAVACDLGEPVLIRGCNRVNTQKILDILATFEALEVRSERVYGELENMDLPLLAFLEREAEKVRSGKRPVVNFVQVCQILISFAASRIVQLGASPSTRLGITRGYASELIWETVKTDCEAQNVDMLAQHGISSFDDVKAMWSDLENESQSPQTGLKYEIGALARKGWNMLPWT